MKNSIVVGVVFLPDPNADQVIADASRKGGVATGNVLSLLSRAEYVRKFNAACDTGGKEPNPRYPRLPVHTFRVQRSQLDEARAVFATCFPEGAQRNIAGTLTQWRRKGNWLFLDVALNDLEAFHRLQVQVAEACKPWHHPTWRLQPSGWMSRSERAALQRYGDFRIGRTEQFVTLGHWPHHRLPQVANQRRMFNVPVRFEHAALAVIGKYGQCNELLEMPVPI